MIAGRIPTNALLAVGFALSVAVARAGAQNDGAVATDSAVRRDTLRGRSGKLAARMVTQGSAAIRVLQELFGDSAAHRPGIYRSTGDRPFSFIRLLPFGAKSGDRIGAYRLGAWPAERRAAAQGANVESADEAVPDGFIEITSENQDTRVSEHFRLRDFLTHDQQNVWPKYLVLREALIDKLELIIADLRARGYRASHLAVLSGFRTPQYNGQGVRRGGRARDSRHQYGDAADVFVDSDRDGRMDDLNRDGRVDRRDARILMESVDRVERDHPALVGGASVYRATRSHGPFVHVDVRGARVRWGD
jgi:hypothetical protein